jgi:hypothetical protein
MEGLRGNTVLNDSASSHAGFEIYQILHKHILVQNIILQLEQKYSNTKGKFDIPNSPYTNQTPLVV